MSNKYRIKFIVIHYGNEDLLKLCLQSIKKHGYSLTDVTVVDNNVVNRGFAGGSNHGYELIKDQNDFDAVLFMNNDVQLLSILDPLTIELMREGVGIVGPLQINKDKSFIYEGVIDNKRYTAGHDITVVMKKNTNTKIADFISGSFMLVKKEVLDKIGRFDERFFMYYEDVDFCTRARKFGYSCSFVSKILVSHLESVHIKRSVKEYYLARNHLLFVEKHAPWGIKILEIIRFPKTCFEHYSDKEKLGGLLGIKDYFFRKFGKK
ncbi:glycosyltransferase family 2 protein [Candidatus Microgenomates bacterium]|nr:glycosyltransferase family 2 protein [Candidatus Microgenomates bacterium]